jgi:hypothetical protein
VKKEKDHYNQYRKAEGAPEMTDKAAGKIVLRRVINKELQNMASPQQAMANPNDSTQYTFYVSECPITTIKSVISLLLRDVKVPTERDGRLFRIPKESTKFGDTLMSTVSNQISVKKSFNDKNNPTVMYLNTAPLDQQVSSKNFSTSMVIPLDKNKPWSIFASKKTLRNDGKTYALETDANGKIAMERVMRGAQTNEGLKTAVAKLLEYTV